MLKFGYYTTMMMTLDIVLISMVTDINNLFLRIVICGLGCVGVYLGISVDNPKISSENPFSNYEPSYFVGKFFTYGDVRFRIVEYVSKGQDDQSCLFRCYNYANAEEIIWYENELCLAISKNDVMLEI